MPTINRESTTDAPPPKRRNMRTLSANRMEYLLANYPADWTWEQNVLWSREQVLRAMQAAFNAGRRDRKGER